MSDIPEDILKTAREVRERFVGDGPALRPWPRLDEEVARAIMAERERCARELDEAAVLRRNRAATSDNNHDHTVALTMAHELEFIAAAIRNA